MRRLLKGRLNLLDISVVALIFFLLGALVSFRLSRKDQWINIQLVVANDDWWYEGSPPQWWYAQDLAIGQKARNSFGEEIAQIIDVTNIDVGEYRRRIFVQIKIKGSYDKRKEIYLFNYQPLQVGKVLDFTFGKNNVRGIVTYIDEIPQEYISRIIEVRIPAVRSWVSDTFKEGMEMQDAEGKSFAKILSVNVYPSKAIEVTELSEGIQNKFSGSLFNEVVLKLQIKTFLSDGVEYFVDRAAVKVGNKIWFQFPQTVVRDAEIVKIFN